jgi:8-oxo-dGTP diphosphatase
MANQQLYDKTYTIPPEVLKGIQVAKASSSNGNGLKRANFILKNGAMPYTALVKLKHDFDNNNFTDAKQYALAGGDQMKAFIEKTLAADRNAVEQSKTIKQDMTTDPNSELAPYQTPRLNEEDKKKKELTKNVCAVIVDKDDKILLLKRAATPKIWMPSKWALVGGGIDKDETPLQAIKREIMEEIGLEIDKFIKTFTIQRHESSVEHIFACRYEGEPTDIKLNEENTNYGWYDVDEMQYLDTVPHLLEYITLTFVKYD